MNGSRFKLWLCDDSGATMVEYSLLVGLVSIAIVFAIISISGSLGSIWSTLGSIVAQAAG